MLHHWRYLKYVLRHKWFVFLECLKLGVPLWIAIFHDWDKFKPDEWRAYVDYLYCEKTPDPHWTTTDPKTGIHGPIMHRPAHIEEAWDQAVNLHFKRNRHHWQFYVFTPPKPRPNFAVTSHDDGMTHAMISSYSKGDVALVYDNSLEWLKPNDEALKQLKREFKMTPVLLKMPDVYAREMLADWRAMSRASGGDAKTWYLQNRDTIFLHPDTQAWIEEQLGIVIDPPVESVPPAEPEPPVVIFLDYAND